MSGTRIPLRWRRASARFVLLALFCFSISYTTDAKVTNLRHLSLQRALQQSETEEGTNIQVTFTTNPDVSSDDDEPTPSRVVLDPLTVRMSPQTSILSTVDLRFLQNTMEVMAIEYIVAMKNGGSRNRQLASSQFEYVRFGSAKQVYNDAGTAIVTFALVVAQFSSQPIPEADTLRTWIEQSLSTANLLPELQSSDTSSSFAALNNVSVAFVVSSTAPPANGSTSPPTTEETQKSTERDNSVPIIAGAAVGGLVVCALLLAAFTKRRRREVIPVESPLNLAETDFSSSSPQKRQSRSTYTTPASTPDTKPETAGADSRSVADSESEWTVGTEAGDSMALKSLVPPSAAATSSLRHPEPWVLSESFERDRPVNITKDMLTGQWSGRVSNLRTSGAAQSDSVLQPSYFSASQERRVRKAAADRESSSVSGEEDDSGAEDALVFEQAHQDAWGRLGAWSPSRTRQRSTSPHPSSRELS